MLTLFENSMWLRTHLHPLGFCPIPTVRSQRKRYLLQQLSSKIFLDTNMDVNFGKKKSVSIYNRYFCPVNSRSLLKLRYTVPTELWIIYNKRELISLEKVQFKTSSLNRYKRFLDTPRSISVGVCGYYRTVIFWFVAYTRGFTVNVSCDWESATPQPLPEF